MKTKIVYCIASSKEDYIYEQLLISLYSLRRYNQDAIVEVVCDEQTFETLKDERSGCFSFATNVIHVETPEGWTMKEKSRFLKTNLRMLVSGDFLFVDTDTIICENLDFIDNLTCEIGAILDNWAEGAISNNNEHSCIISYAKKINANVCGMYNFNSGVIFAKDTPSVHKLYKKWSEGYQQYKNVVDRDQLSLILANERLGNIIKQIDRNLNCIVTVPLCRNNIENAVIIHYIGSHKNNFIISSPWLLDAIKESGVITAPINSIIERPKSFFSTRSRIVFGDDVDILSTSFHAAYLEIPHIYKLLISKFLAFCVRTNRLLMNFTH